MLLASGETLTEQQVCVRARVFVRVAAGESFDAISWHRWVWARAYVMPCPALRLSYTFDIGL